MNGKKMEKISEKKKILDKIVKKSVQCSKATIDLTTKVLDALMAPDKEQLITLSENGLPDDLPELRSLVWKINLGYLSYNTFEWDKFLVSKRLAYQNYRTFVFNNLDSFIIFPHSLTILSINYNMSSKTISFIEFSKKTPIFYK